MRKLFTAVFLCITFFGLSAGLYAQTYTLSGKVLNKDNGEVISGANVFIPSLSIGAVTDANGYFSFGKIPQGNQTVKVSCLGFVTFEQNITFNSDLRQNFSLIPTAIQSKEVIVEANRAKERETPVAFSNIEAKQLEQKLHGQDAPLMVKGTPGVFTYSTDGVGNGEAKVMVRGFSQDYVQVLINGIPTNDPESNSVYWSNWGSVSSNASSIQIQRGAGSSLYGAGSFGGSFNIVTDNPAAQPYYGAKLTLGSPKNTMYGIMYNTGLINDKFAFSLNIDRKIAEGSRHSGRYEGVNYYTSFSYYPTTEQSIKFVLHGAPQEHGYSWSNPASYFKKYGYDANSAPFLPKSVVSSLKNNYGLLDDSRELVDDDFVNLSHNFYHKPQAELHYSYALDKTSRINATFFYSMGRGAGSSINSPGTTFAFKGDTLTTSLYGPDGYITDTASAAKYLKSAFQRISYSFHRQTGIIANYSSKPVDFLNLTVGGEFRSWRADHPGHFTNLFGKGNVTQSYAFVDTTGKVSKSTFSRKVSQGDLEGPSSDIGNIFSWDLSGKDPAYNTQYRNYVGETPQYTIFAQGNWIFDKLNIMTSLQYVWYKYKLTENMPSESAIGRLLKPAEVAALGITGEGPKGDKFYMKDDKTGDNYYEFNLVRATRSRGFLQPKVGLNYNIDDNFNVFGNFAHVERFANLSVYYNQGRINPDAEDEKSDQFELGTGYTNDWLRTKINGYYMTWKNKAASIQDVSKAGEPGYDRNGNRTELIGTSRNLGVEFEFFASLNQFLPVDGFGLRGSLTYMDNTWTEILSSVLVDNNLGTLQEDANLNGVLDNGEDSNNNKKLDENRRVFNNSSLDAMGKKDAVYFSELKDKHVASGPQSMASIGLTFDYQNFFATVDMNYYARNYLLDGDSYLAVDGEWKTVGTKEVFTSEYDTQLKPAGIFDLSAGYNLEYNGMKTQVSLQLLNAFNTEYFAAADRNGVYPGLLRTVRLNVSIGM